MISGSLDLEVFSSYLQRETLTKIYTTYNDGTLFSGFCMIFFESLRAMSPKFVDYFFLNNFSSVSSSPPLCPHLYLDTSHPSPKQYHILLMGRVSCLPTHGTRIFSDALLSLCSSWIKAPALCSAGSIYSRLQCGSQSFHSPSSKYKNSRLGLSKSKFC